MPPAASSLRLQARLFTTSTAHATTVPNPFTTIKNLSKQIAKKNQPGPAPPHPYRPRTTYKQSNQGLYGGAHIQYGNQISEKNEIKTRRYWRPNIQTKQLWSEALGRMIRLRLQARVLRTIDKVGGLDEYILGNKAQRIKELGPGGWALRWCLVNSNAVKTRFRHERKRLGVPKMSIKNRLELRERVEAIQEAGMEGVRSGAAELSLEAQNSSRSE